MPRKKATKSIKPKGCCGAEETHICCKELSNIKDCIKKHEDKLKKTYVQLTKDAKKCIAQTTTKVAGFRKKLVTAKKQHQAALKQQKTKVTQIVKARVKKAKLACKALSDEIKKSTECGGHCKKMLAKYVTEHKELLAKEKALTAFAKTWAKKLVKKRKPKSKRKAKKSK